VSLYGRRLLIPRDPTLWQGTIRCRVFVRRVLSNKSERVLEKDEDQDAVEDHDPHTEDEAVLLRDGREEGTDQRMKKSEGREKEQQERMNEPCNPSEMEQCPPPPQGKQLGWLM